MKTFASFILKSLLPSLLLKTEVLQKPMRKISKFYDLEKIKLRRIREVVRKGNKELNLDLIVIIQEADSFY